jgi:hypothetical protein
MVKNKTSTYLAGPIGVIIEKGAMEWRQNITASLSQFGIEVLNPMGKAGGDRLGKNRAKLKKWMEDGNIERVREFSKNIIIPPDLKMVEECTFVTLYVPEDNGYEICGTYGEATLECYFKKPLLVVTDRCLKPIKIPAWLVGCSTKVFSNWKEYLEYIEDTFVDD